MADLLDEFKEHMVASLRDGATDYFFHIYANRIEIKKMDGSRLLAHYVVKKLGKIITCSCPAGSRGINCKHKKWLHDTLFALEDKNSWIYQSR